MSTNKTLFIVAISLSNFNNVKPNVNNQRITPPNWTKLA